MGDLRIDGGASIDLAPSASSPVPSSPASATLAVPEKKRQPAALLAGMLKPLAGGRVRLPARHILLVSVLLVLVLCTNFLASFPVVPPSTAFALAFKNPNPPIPTPSWLKPSSQPSAKPNLNKSAPAPATSTQPSGVPQVPQRVPMRPARLLLSEAAQRFVSSDGLLEVDIPAGSLDARFLAQHQGQIALVITQVRPAAGSTDSASSLISFGTYEFQFFTVSGRPLSGVTLLHPLTLQLRLPQADQALFWPGQQVYTIWTPVQGAATPPALPAANAQHVYAALAPRGLSGAHPRLVYAQSGSSDLHWSIQTTLSTPATSTSTPSGTATPAAHAPAPAVQASTVAFNTTAPQATWGKPDDFRVGLNSGSLDYTYPLDIPSGPGGLTPPLSLTYSSASLDDNHNVQAAAPWVGQGWNLDLGSITWAQEDVTPNGSATYENVWNINDPSGISGQLIPPDRTYSTDGTLNPSLSNLPTVSNLSSSNMYIWHTAPESHVKVREIAFGSYPCWLVYLPDGTMEEYGCTNDSRESYNVNGVWNAYSWNLNLIVDRYGNQVQVSYQQNFPSGYVRDAVIKDITYDAPNCHSTTSECTGSAWDPQVDLHFDASTLASNLLSGNCGSWTNTYDAYGNQLTTTDPDNHLGCTLGSAQYSDCATYDSTFETELLTSTNAKNQTTSYGYSNTAAGGYGQWLTSETDPNGQTTSYQYDALGRLTGTVEPGDSASSPTVTYTYTNTCTAGSTTPCLELDTSVTSTSGGPASTEKQWYDGEGRLVETQAPSPNPNDVIVTYTVYNSMNGSQVVDQTIQSLPYAIATPSGYVAPDLTQERTVTNYDSLGRTIGSVTYDNTGTIVQESSTSYTIATGVPTLSDTNPYEQTITLDAYNHQSITYTDGPGRTRYSQVYSGTASPYSVVRTVGATYDMLDDPASTTTYGSSGTVQVSSNVVYNGIQEPVGYNDSDQGRRLLGLRPTNICSTITRGIWCSPAR